MDPQTEEKKDTAKLSSKAKSFTPSTKMKTAAKEYHPSQQPETQPEQVNANFEQQNQPFDPNQLLLNWTNSYMDQGYSQDDAQMYAMQYLQQNYPDYYQYPEGQYQEQYQDPYYGTGEEYQQDHQTQQIEGHNLEEEKEPEQQEDFNYGSKTKKPHGNRRKEKYQGKHHENYDGSEEGFYDEFGFYYLPDGSFYDPDGYYFDPQGYDQFGGYYDDNANYIAPENQEDNYGGKGFRKNKNRHYNNQGYAFGEDDYYEEEIEEQYTKEYIDFVIESKYYEDMEYLKNTQNEWAYLKAGNLVDATTKQDLLKYFGNQNIDTSQITIEMTGTSSTIAKFEIYSIQVAIQVLKLCGQEFKGRPIIIEVDQHNEKVYGNVNPFHELELEDQEEARYTKFDNYEQDPATIPAESKEEVK